MAALKADGFSIAIDDVGTGFSSLAYLRQLSADKQKIHMSFVRDTLNARHDHTLVTTILAWRANSAWT